MMAKDKDDRYNNIEELMIDLKSVRDGQPPIRAHKRFDVSMLEELEEGEAVDEGEEYETEETLAKYRMVIVI